MKRYILPLLAAGAAAYSSEPAVNVVGHGVHAVGAAMEAFSGDREGIHERLCGTMAELAASGASPYDLKKAYVVGAPHCFPEPTSPGHAQYTDAIATSILSQPQRFDATRPAYTADDKKRDDLEAALSYTDKSGERTDLLNPALELELGEFARLGKEKAFQSSVSSDGFDLQRSLIKERFRKIENYAQRLGRTEVLEIAKEDLFKAYAKLLAERVGQVPEARAVIASLGSSQEDSVTYDEKQRLEDAKAVLKQPFYLLEALQTAFDNLKAPTGDDKLSLLKAYRSVQVASQEEGFAYEKIFFFENLLKFEGLADFVRKDGNMKNLVMDVALRLILDEDKEKLVLHAGIPAQELWEILGRRSEASDLKSALDYYEKAGNQVKVEELRPRVLAQMAEEEAQKASEKAAAEEAQKQGQEQKSAEEARLAEAYRQFSQDLEDGYADTAYSAYRDEHFKLKPAQALALAHYLEADQTGYLLEAAELYEMGGERASAQRIYVAEAQRLMDAKSYVEAAGFYMKAGEESNYKSAYLKAAEASLGDGSPAASYQALIEFKLAGLTKSGVAARILSHYRPRPRDPLLYPFMQANFSAADLLHVDSDLIVKACAEYFSSPEDIASALDKFGRHAEALPYWKSAYASAVEDENWGAAVSFGLHAGLGNEDLTVYAQAYAATKDTIDPDQFSINFARRADPALQKIYAEAYYKAHGTTEQQAQFYCANGSVNTGLRLLAGEHAWTGLKDSLSPGVWGIGDTNVKPLLDDVQYLADVEACLDAAKSSASLRP